MKYVVSIMVAALLLMMVTGTALATWPSGSQGDQYAAVNGAMENATANAGISSQTFIDIYNDAIVAGVSTYSDSQLNAACSVMSSLSSYQSVLEDYNTVYNNLDCSNRLAGASTRSELPSTGIAMVILLVSGGLGIIAATQLLKRRRAKA